MGTTAFLNRLMQLLVIVAPLCGLTSSASQLLAADDTSNTAAVSAKEVFVVERPQDWKIAEGRIECNQLTEKRDSCRVQLLSHSLDSEAGHLALSVRAGLVNDKPASSESAVGWLLGDGLFVGVDGVGRAVIRDEKKPNADRGIQVGSATVGISGHAVLQDIAIRVLGAVDTSDETKFVLRVSIHDPETNRLFSATTRIVDATRLVGQLSLQVSPGSAGEPARYWLGEWQASGSKVSTPLNARGVVALASPLKELAVKGATSYRSQDSLYFKMAAWPKSSQLVMPRINNPIRRVYFANNPNEELKLTPEPGTWVIALPKSDSHPNDAVVVLETIGEPSLTDEPAIIQANAEGIYVLPAHKATTFGEMLRYEPQPHKNTVGYWVKPKDYAQWHLNMATAGEFSVHILQGCGKGQGGSEVEIHIRREQHEANGDHAVADPALAFTVLDTGHFQNFVPRELGIIQLDEPGSYLLELRPKRLAKNAVMDVREIKLVPVTPN